MTKPDMQSGVILRGLEGLDPQHAASLLKSLGRIGLTIEPLTTSEQGEWPRRPVKYFAPSSEPSETIALDEDDIRRTAQVRNYNKGVATRVVGALRRLQPEEEEVCYLDPEQRIWVFSYDWVRSIAQPNEQGWTALELDARVHAATKSIDLLGLALLDKRKDIEHSLGETQQ